jgi:hypothetical protein
LRIYCISYLQKDIFALVQLLGAEVSARQIKQQVDVVVLAELLHTVLVHLHGADVLLLLNVYVRNVQPHVGKVGRRFTHLSKYVARLLHVTFLRQNAACNVQVKLCTSPFSETTAYRFRWPPKCSSVAPSTLS